MCYFLTVGVPAARAARLDEWLGDGLRVQPCDNPSVAAAFPRTFVLSLVTVGGVCSCPLYSKPRSAADDDAERLARRKRFARRGWGEAKIDRALAQSERPGPAGLDLMLAERLKAACGSTGTIAVLVHWYTGRVEDEAVAVAAEQTCDVQASGESDARRTAASVRRVGRALTPVCSKPAAPPVAAPATPSKLAGPLKFVSDCTVTRKSGINNGGDQDMLILDASACLDSANGEAKMKEAAIGTNVPKANKP